MVRWRLFRVLPCDLAGPCSQAAVWPCSQPARLICVRRGRGSRVSRQGSVSERPKVQHSKCCVVSQPPWVQIPALPPLPPGPNGAGRFCYAWMVCGRVRVLRDVDGVLGAAGVPGAVGPGRPRDRHTRAYGSEWSISKPALALRTSGTLHTGGACVAVRGWARRLEAWPGPAPPTGTAAHGFHSLAQQVLRCPPYWSCKPPSGGGEITVRGGVMPKVQTTSAKNAENGLLWAKWSAFWAHRYRS